MKQKVSIFIVIFMALAFFAGCTSDNQADIQRQEVEPQVTPIDNAEDDVQELTFHVITEFNVYTNDELSTLLLEEIINSSPELWGFMVLEPNQPIQESTFIQVGTSWADTAKFNLEIGFGNAETGPRLYRLVTEDKNVVLQYFIDYWQEQRIPDISLWEDVSYIFR